MYTPELKENHKNLEEYEGIDILYTYVILTTALVRVFYSNFFSSITWKVFGKRG
jgi:hypothetical protein